MLTLSIALQISPGEETPERFAARFQEAVDHANAAHRHADLCRQMPQRLDDLVKTHTGDRQPKRNFMLIIRCVMRGKTKSTPPMEKFDCNST